MSLLDVPLLEQQLLGLVWRGNKIDHPGGEHDDWANAAAGVAHLCAAPAGSILDNIHVIDTSAALHADTPTARAAQAARAMDSPLARFLQGE